MLVIAFIGVLLQYIINYDPETVTDLQTYVLAALVAAVQAAATAVLALLGPGGFSK